jgi:hypothetical protein
VSCVDLSCSCPNKRHETLVARYLHGNRDILIESASPVYKVRNEENPIDVLCEPFWVASSSTETMTGRRMEHLRHAAFNLLQVYRWESSAGRIPIHPIPLSTDPVHRYCTFTLARLPSGMAYWLTLAQCPLVIYKTITHQM